jgi:hypothetical protein
MRFILFFLYPCTHYEFIECFKDFLHTHMATKVYTHLFNLWKVHRHLTLDRLSIKKAIEVKKRVSHTLVGVKVDQAKSGSHQFSFFFSIYNSSCSQYWMHARMRLSGHFSKVKAISHDRKPIYRKKTQGEGVETTKLILNFIISNV